MLIESRYALEIESKIPMKIIFSEEKSINCLGRIASCSLVKNEEPEQYDIGVEFLDMSEQDREILNEFIRLLDNINGGFSYI
jgi:c-di-GMP-binding flagellar brake protein YcgR